MPWSYNGWDICLERTSRISAPGFNPFNGNTDAFPMIGKLKIASGSGFGSAHHSDHGTIFAILGEQQTSGVDDVVSHAKL
jgi:hypothetical protein